MALEETRVGVGVHGFWRRGTTALFDVHTVNLFVGSNLCITPEKALAKVEKEKKEKSFKICLDRRRHFTPLFLSADGIPGA